MVLLTKRKRKKTMTQKRLKSKDKKDQQAKNIQGCLMEFFQMMKMRQHLQRMSIEK